MDIALRLFDLPTGEMLRVMGLGPVAGVPREWAVEMLRSMMTADRLHTRRREVFLGSSVRRGQNCRYKKENTKQGDNNVL